MTARRVPGRAVAAVTLALLGALGLGSSGAALAPTAVDPTAPVTAVTSATLDVQVTGVSPTILRPGDDLTVSATLHNGTDAEVAAPGAALRLYGFRLTTRTQLATWSSGEGASGTVFTTTRAEAPLAPGQSVTLEMTVHAQDVPFLDLPDVWGARGLTVDALSGTRRTAQRRTFVVWQPAGVIPQVRVSTLVPVTGPPAAPVSRTDLSPTDPSQAGPSQAGTGAPGTEPTTRPTAADEATVARLDAVTAPTGRLSRLLGALTENPEVAVAVDPALVAAARSAGPSARAWSDALVAALSARETWALPWADPDVAALAHADRPDLVALAVSTGTTASTLPVRGTLLWAPPGSGPDTATVATTAGTEAAAIVLGPDDAGPASTTAPTPATTATSARARLETSAGPVTALLPDPTLTHLVTDPGSVEQGATTATVVQRMLAELAVVAQERSEETPQVLIAPGRTWTPDLDRLDTVLDAVRDAPWVTTTRVQSLLSGGATARAGVPATAHDETELAPDSVRALGDARTRVGSFATVTTDPQALLDGVDAEVLAPLSVAWRSDPSGRDALVARVLTDVDARTNGLSIGPVSDLRVISATSNVHMSVRNALPVPATVLLDVRPRKACLEVGETKPVTVPAGAERSVVVPLQANANCEVGVVARLTSPDGADVAEPVEFVARVSPRIENVGTIVVGVLLALGLVLGIVRTVRRGQSARRGARTQSDPDAGPTTLPVLGGTPDTGSVPRAPQ